MIERLRRLSPRAEKTVRLVVACALGSVFGIAGVVRESEPLGYAGAAIVLAAILLGPVVNRLLAAPGRSGA